MPCLSDVHHGAGTDDLSDLSEVWTDTLTFLEPQPSSGQKRNEKYCLINRPLIVLARGIIGVLDASRRTVGGGRGDVCGCSLSRNASEGKTSHCNGRDWKVNAMVEKNKQTEYNSVPKCSHRLDSVLMYRRSL